MRSELRIIPYVHFRGYSGRLAVARNPYIMSALCQKRTLTSRNLWSLRVLVLNDLLAVFFIIYTVKIYSCVYNNFLNQKERVLPCLL